MRLTQQAIVFVAEIPVNKKCPLREVKRGAPTATSGQVSSPSRQSGGDDARVRKQPG